MKVFVMGGKLTGTDFVTAGPDKLLMVLRDPPGANSFSYAEKGSTISHTTSYSGSVDQCRRSRPKNKCWCRTGYMGWCRCRNH